MFKELKFSNNGGSLIGAFAIFYYMQPYFFWYGIMGSFFVSMTLSVIMAALFLKNKSINKNNYILVFLFLLIFILYTSLSGKNIFFFLSVLPFVFLPFANNDYSEQVYNNLLSIICIVMILSLLSWVGSLLGFFPAMGSVEPINPLKDYKYTRYIFSIAAPDSYRFNGVFDEAGVVGTLCGVLLCIQKCNFKDKRSIVLLVAGLCSMSLFFYLLLASYLILYYLVIKRNIMKTLGVLSLIFISLSVIHSIPVVEELLGERLQLTDEGTLAGDNRTSDLYWDLFSQVKGTHEFWFGLDDEDSFRDLTKGECSVYITIFVYGVFLCGLYLIFIVLYGLQYKKNWASFFLYLYVFFVCVYQRPFIFTAYFIFLWTYLARIGYGGEKKHVAIK